MLGQSPQQVSRLRPGKHYVVARWTHALERRILRVGKGRRAKLEIRLDGPSEEARQELLQTIRERMGTDAAREAAAKVAALARAQRVVVAAIQEREEKRHLVVAVHDADGDLVQVVQSELPAAEDEKAAEAVGRTGVALFVDAKQEPLALDAEGRSSPMPGLGRQLYEGVRGGAAAPVTALAPQTDPTLVAEPPPPDSEDSNGIPSWWWIAAGAAAVVAAGVTAGVLLSGGDANTTQFEVRLP